MPDDPPVMWMEIASSPEYVAAIIEIIDNYASAFGMVDDHAFHFTLAVEEIAINAMKHGNNYDPGKFVRIELYDNGEDLVATVADQSPVMFPYVPGSGRVESYDLLAPDGRGLGFAEHFSDKIEYEFLNPGNKLIIRKKKSQSSTSVDHGHLGEQRL